MAEEMNTSVIETEDVDGAPGTEDVKTYTQEEVLALIQSETDKRVSQALKTQQKKYEQQLSLSKLDGEERAKAEKDNRIAELEEQLAAFQVEKNRSELKSVLSSRGLSAEFADLVKITDDIEESQETIAKLDSLFRAAVKAEVEKRLAGNAPKGNGVAAAFSVTPLIDNQNIVSHFSGEGMSAATIPERMASVAVENDLHRRMIPEVIVSSVKGDAVIGSGGDTFIGILPHNAGDPVQMLRDSLILGALDGILG